MYTRLHSASIARGERKLLHSFCRMMLRLPCPTYCVAARLIECEMSDGKFVLLHDFCFFVWCLNLLGCEGHILVYRITSTVSACEVGDLLGYMRVVMSGNETAMHYNGGSV